MRALPSFFLVIAFSLLFAAPLHAASPGLCNDFAAAVVKRAEQNKKNQCGFSDANNYNHREAQKRWCLKVTDEKTVVDESLRRDRETRKCAICRQYSNVANATAHEARMFRCGFDDPLWSVSERHFPNCLALPGNVGITGLHWEGFVRDEMAQRLLDLKQCKAQIDQKFSEVERNVCHDYKNKAMLHTNFNANKKCGAIPDGRWTTIDNEHFMWCLTNVGTEAGKAVIAGEQQIRENAVAICQRGGYLTADGRPIKKMGKPRGLATQTMEGRPSSQKSGGAGGAPTGGGGSNTARSGDNTGASGSGGAGGAMDRLGGGTGGSYPSRSGDSKPGGSGAPKPGGAAIITPAAGAPSAGTETRGVKSMNKIGSERTIDYGGGAGRSTPAPVR